METNKALSEILNDLIQIHNDRIQGYEKAIEDAPGDSYKNIFEKMIEQSTDYRQKLINAVRETGGNPEWNSTTASGKVYRMWTDVKSAFTGHSEKSALELCEFGEDAARTAYEESLKVEEMPEKIKDLLASQQLGLQQSYNEIKDLKDIV